MRRLDHINIIQLKYFFFSSEEKVSDISCVCNVLLLWQPVLHSDM